MTEDCAAIYDINSVIDSSAGTWYKALNEEIEKYLIYI